MNNLPNRKKLRLEYYNYSSNGFYFLTILTKNHKCMFGKIIDGKMFLNEYGKILENEIIQTEILRAEIEIEEFIIMPNHFHILIYVRSTGLWTLQEKEANHHQTKNIISNCIQRIKGQFTSKVRKLFNDYEFMWQKSFYDEIIKNEDHLENVKNYIIFNPKNWQDDENNPNNFL